MNYKKFDAKPFFEIDDLTEMFWEGTGISYRYQFLICLGNSKSSLPTQEDSGLSAIEYTSVKEELSDISTDHCDNVGDLRSCIHITDLLKVQPNPCVTNIAELSSHPQQRR